MGSIMRDEMEKAASQSNKLIRAADISAAESFRGVGHSCLNCGRGFFSRPLRLVLKILGGHLLEDFSPLLLGNIGKVGLFSFL